MRNGFRVRTNHLGLWLSFTRGLTGLLPKIPEVREGGLQTRTKNKDLEVIYRDVLVWSLKELMESSELYEVKFWVHEVTEKGKDEGPGRVEKGVIPKVKEGTRDKVISMVELKA